MTTPASKTCPGYGADGPHDLPATTEYFQRNAPAKDGLFYQCKAHANAYQSDWSAKRRAIAKADALEPGVERDQALDAAYALPPVSKRKAAVDMAPAPKPKPAQAAAAPKAPQGTAANPDNVRALRHPNGTPVFTATAAQVAAREEAEALAAAQAAKPGWGISRVAGLAYAIPTATATVGTPEGQAALAAVAQAKRAADAQRKRDERAKAKAEATASLA